MTAPSRPKRRVAKTTPYHWFQGASVRELYDRLTAVGPDTARLEVHTDGKKMTLQVTGETAAAVSPTPPINDSHLCPPQCP